MKESKFQKHVIDRLKDEYPGCLILKNDPNYIQGIPDLIFLYKDFWAAFEIKKNEESSHRPNQDYYICKMNDMSFASFIFPENEEEVFDDLEQAFKRSTRRSARISKRKQVFMD